MIPGAFDYHRPDSLDEAIGLLARHGDQAKILSGGMSLLPLLKLRLASVAHLVDIGRIPGLDYIKEEGGMLKIGGATRQVALERSEIVRSRYPILLDTVTLIADPLVRNRATVAGNVANGDPANDHPASMIALGATVVARGRSGERTIPINQFYRGVFSTALAPDEILTEIRIPTPPARSGGAYFKVKRKVGDYAAAAAAVQLTLGQGGEFERAGIALTNAGPTPLEASEAQRYLLGKRAEEAVITQAARMAAAKASPSADLRGSIEYKRDVARVLVARALRRAVERAGGH